MCFISGLSQRAAHLDYWGSIMLAKLYMHLKLNRISKFISRLNLLNFEQADRRLLLSTEGADKKQRRHLSKMILTSTIWLWTLTWNRYYCIGDKLNLKKLTCYSVCMWTKKTRSNWWPHCFNIHTFVKMLKKFATRLEHHW